jgi:large subunit ribosomal protein L23
MVGSKTQSKVLSKGFVLAPHQVIVRPLVTEKGIHAANTINQYTFEISSFASKDDVRKAVTELFNVKVLKVRTQQRKGKSRRHKFRMGQTKGWKKAIVTLDAESRIDFF